MRVKTVRLVAIAITALAALASVAAAPPQALDPAALDEAFRLGRTRRASELDRFTAPYVVTRGGPGSPTIEVITEFRRAVMLTRQQADLGNYSWTPTNLARTVAKFEGLTTIRAEVWLSPNHLYVGTPSYRMDLYTAARDSVKAIEEKRDPILAPTTPDGGSAMTGVTLENLYRDAALREPGCCLVIVVDPKGETVVKQEVEFASLR